MFKNKLEGYTDFKRKEKMVEGETHQKIIDQIRKGDRYITNLTKGVKVKVEFFGKKMFLKEGQSLDLYTGKKVDFLKNKKKIWVKFIRQIPFKRGKDIGWAEFKNRKEAIKFFKENIGCTPIRVCSNYKNKKIFKDYYKK